MPVYLSLYVYLCISLDHCTLYHYQSHVKYPPFFPYLLLLYPPREWDIFSNWWAIPLSVKNPGGWTLHTRHTCLFIQIIEKEIIRRKLYGTTTAITPMWRDKNREWNCMSWGGGKPNFRTSRVSWRGGGVTPHLLYTRLTNLKFKGQPWTSLLLPMSNILRNFTPYPTEVGWLVKS